MCVCSCIPPCSPLFLPHAALRSNERRKKAKNQTPPPPISPYQNSLVSSTFWSKYSEFQFSYLDKIRWLYKSSQYDEKWIIARSFFFFFNVEEYFFFWRLKRKQTEKKEESTLSLDQVYLRCCFLHTVDRIHTYGKLKFENLPFAQFVEKIWCYKPPTHLIPVVFFFLLFCFFFHVLLSPKSRLYSLTHTHKERKKINHRNFCYFQLH